MYSFITSFKFYLHEFDPAKVKKGIPDYEPRTDSAHLDLLR